MIFNLEFHIQANFLPGSQESARFKHARGRVFYVLCTHSGNSLWRFFKNGIQKRSQETVDLIYRQYGGVGGILKCQLCSLKSIQIRVRSQRVPRRMLSRRKWVWLRANIIKKVLVTESKHSPFSAKKKKKWLRIPRKPTKQNCIQGTVPNIKQNKCNMTWYSLEDKSVHLK